MPHPDELPVYLISVAAELTGMHPQTLRQYDRLGIVSPRRAPGRGRRYSARDIAELREVQRLSQDEGVNLAGIRRIMALRKEVEQLKAQVQFLRAGLESGHRVFHAASTGETVIRGRGKQRTVSGGALVVWRAPS
jgi:MerR family transcriptional regulator/heat shock protein HspR